MGKEGIGPSTYSLSENRSTTEPLAQNHSGRALHPTKFARQILTGKPNELIAPKFPKILTQLTKEKKFLLNIFF